MSSKRADRIAATYGPKQVCDLLELAQWQLRLAEEHGLLKREPDGRFEREPVDEALLDPASWHARLRMKESITGNQAAEHLGISRPAFNRLVDDGFVRPCGQVSFRYVVADVYLRESVEQARIFLDDQLRTHDAATKERRRLAAEQAVKTRKRNAEEAEQAAGELRERLLAASALQDRAERELALASIWLMLLCGHADDAQDQGRRARKPARMADLQHTARDLFAIKDAALQQLAPIVGGRVTLRLIDGSRVWLCDDCREEARSEGVPFRLYEGCDRCELDHTYTLVELRIRTQVGTQSFFVPYPIAQHWPMPALPPGPTGRRRRRRGERDTTVGLVDWARVLPRSERDGGVGHYDVEVSSGLLRAFDADQTKEHLAAALSNLRDLSEA